jgi:peptide/nickel transport system substrate-binding protein
MRNVLLHVAAYTLLASSSTVCAGATDSRAPTVIAQATPAAAPAAPAGAKRGGTLTVATLSSPRMLDPHKVNSGDDYPHGFWMYNALTRIQPDLTVVPDLADSWKANEDLTKYTFTLRKGVLFHNGQEMTADDVVASIKRVQDPATASISRNFISMVESINAPDRYTVEFGLSSPYANLPTALGAIHMKIAPKELLGTLGEKPVGTGPFKFVELVPGSHMRLVRNDKYFVPGQPYVDEVVYKVLPEALVAATALKRGEIDLWYRVPADQVKELQRAGGDVVIDGVPTGSFDAVIPHNKRKPFNDPKVRLAMDYATDRQKVVDAVLFGYGTAVQTPVSPSSPFFKKDLPLRKQDIAKAKQLLAEAGYPNGLDLTIIAQAGRVNRERLALVIQDMWRPAGIRLKVEKVPADRFVADVEMKADLYASGWAGRATLDQIFNVALHSKASYNMFHYENPKLDMLLDDAKRARTVEEQARLYGLAQQAIYDNPPGVIVYVQNDYSATRKAVRNFKVHPLFGVLYLDGVWLDK